MMSIAGDHANNDMNGNTGETDPEEQSWRERLEAEGYQVTDVMKGLGDYDEIVAIWMQHLSDAMND
jgi:sirohydrochlorin cobaltochelatase